MNTLRTSAFTLCLCALMLASEGCKPDWEIETPVLPSDLDPREAFEAFPPPGVGTPGPHYIVAHSIMAQYDSLIQDKLGIHLAALRQCNGKGMKWKEGKELWMGEYRFVEDGVEYNVLVEALRANVVWQFYIAPEGINLPTVPSMAISYSGISCYPIREASQNFISMNITRGATPGPDVSIQFELEKVDGGDLTCQYIASNPYPWKVFADGPEMADEYLIEWNPVTNEGKVSPPWYCGPTGCCWDGTLADVTCP